MEGVNGRGEMRPHFAEAEAEACVFRTTSVRGFCTDLSGRHQDDIRRDCREENYLQKL